MKHRRRPSFSAPTAQINITSLLDITFVLLVSFMVVAPAMMHGVDIDLPKVREAETVTQSKPIRVTVPYQPDRPEVRVDGATVTVPELVARITAAGGGEGRAVTLEGDGRVDWELMTQVISELRNGGIVNIGILTEVDSQVY